MQVALAGYSAAILGAAGPLATALAAALTRAGASPVAALPAGPAPEDADILAAISTHEAPLPAPAFVTAARAAAERMASRGAGRILVIAPAAGLVPSAGDEATAAAAAALFAAMRALALALAPRGVLLNGLAMISPAPGPRLLAHVPIGRLPTAAEIIDAALFLLDPENTYTVGHILVVDGGFGAGFARDF